MMNGKLLIDISYHNGTIDWKLLKRSCDGVIIRCGYGGDYTKQDDKKFKSNIVNAIKNGFKIGVYLYSYAKDEVNAKNEAKHVIRLLNEYKDKLYYPVFIDLEEDCSKKNAKKIATTFCNILQDKGYTVGVYANEYWWNNFLKDLKGYTRWVAKYGVNNGKPNKQPNIAFDIWQYTDKGFIKGINGYVDLNLDVSYKKDIVKEVIEGKWGNGEERKKRLTKAGYNYKDVQSKVNERLRKK